MPFYSIITVTLNSEKYLSRCIQSILNQSFRDFEFIIIDGASSDETSNIVNNIKDRRLKFISEPDNGIYDAMNKGLAIAKGKIISILNSDDLYYSEKVLEKLKKVFDLNYNIAIGDIAFFANNKTEVFTRYWKVKPYYKGAFAEGWYAPHPGFFFNRKLYLEFGGFDLSYKTSADFELILRYIERDQSPYILGELTTLQQVGGFSSKFNNIIIGNENVRRCLRENGYDMGIIKYYSYRFIPKIINILTHKFKNLSF